MPTPAPFALPRRAGLALLFALVLGPGQLPAQSKSARQRIDDELRAAWKKHGVTPAARADDATFLRRAYLDLVGTIPTAEEARAFLADKDADKRTKLVDRLLADPRFATHQATVWDLVLFGRNPPNGDATRKRDGFRTWLAKHFAGPAVPHDKWVREVLRGAGPGTELFHVQFRSRPEDGTEAISRIFLGTQLQCARCHDHPYEPWTQRDFYGMAGFLVRLVVLDTGAKAGPRFALGEKSTGEVLFSGSVKEQRPGRKGDPVPPKFLGGVALKEPPLPKDFKEPVLKGAKTMPAPVFSRKEQLATWATAKDNPFFARAAVNRVWAQFLGRGLVHPVDDLRPTNDASIPALLDELTKEFTARDFDLKWVIREVVNSEAYQLHFRGATKEALPRWHERARVRPLSAEELLSSMRTGTGFDAAGGKLQGGTVEYFVRYFGEPTNGQGDFQGGLSEHLFLNNAPQVRDFARRRKGSLADVLLTSSEGWEKRVEQLYLALLTRLPTPAEKARFARYLTSDAKAEPLVEEAIWVLLNSAEFRFQH